MKKLFILAIVALLGCSKDNPEESTSCNCEPIRFVYVINRNLGQFGEFTASHCLSYWRNPDFTNIDIDESTSPPTIEGPTEAQVDLIKQRVPCD